MARYRVPARSVCLVLDYLPVITLTNFDAAAMGHTKWDALCDGDSGLIAVARG